MINNSIIIFTLKIQRNTQLIAKTKPITLNSQARAQEIRDIKELTNGPQED